MATEQQRQDAITAVRNGTATDHQKEVVRVAAGQAGSVGDDAREARGERR